MTHHCKGGAAGQVEHLIATHSHQQNHSPVDHAHAAHQNLAREHEHEAYIHDHAPHGELTRRRGYLGVTRQIGTFGSAQLGRSVLSLVMGQAENERRIVEPKGTVNIEKEPFPTDALPPGGGYILKEPDEEGNWVVEVYVWKDSQIVVNQGDTVNLEIVGVNGERHSSFIEEYVDEFVVERGKLTSLSFVADRPGVFKIICTVHQPSMTSELVVPPR